MSFNSLIEKSPPGIADCHTPMRYLWDMYHDYIDRLGPIKRFLIKPTLHYLRLWDQATADRVDHFIANSNHVASRIHKYYRRNAEVIHPPVNIGQFFSSQHIENFYLVVARLVNYKRIDLAVEAFNQLRKKLIIIGGGEAYKQLLKQAGPTVHLWGKQPFDTIQGCYAKCRALIFPGEEDFGLVPVEAMAAGRPVIAYGKGGALETVIEKKTGLFFREQTVESLVDAVYRFENIDDSFDTAECQAQAEKFSKERFQNQIWNFVDEKLNARFE